MKRRQFVKNSSLAAISIGVFGKLVFEKDKFVGDTPTTTDVLGPFYRPGAPFRTDINPPGFTGKKLYLSGTIFKDDGKTPFSDCLIEIWQVNNEGKYDNLSSDFLYRGAAKTDRNGKYNFVTSMPIPYKAGKSYRAAHIHLRVEGAPGEQDLISQIYFKGDPYLQTDMYSADPASSGRILMVTKNEKNEDILHFDIVMSKEFPLGNAAFEKIVGIYDFGKGNLGEFYKKGDLLFSKVNGQISDAWRYTGNNSFEDGMGSKLQFEFLADGGAKVKVDYRDYPSKNIEKYEGTKFLRY
jgi:protocatechuate 3,4-dioxygenase beta subunit